MLKFALALHFLGLMAGLHVILTARTPQGAIAWSISLVTCPYLALPLYLVLGRDRFEGYVLALRAGSLTEKVEGVQEVLDTLEEHRYHPPPSRDNVVRILSRLARVPFTRGNAVDLLVNGEATYGRIFQEIDAARDYILVLYFMLNDDRTGRELKERLIAKAREGVRVMVVFDEVGSSAIQGRFVDDLRQAGVEAWPFYTTRGWRNSFQLNFRNHRKIVVVDGRVALVGGLNLGDEHLGRDPHFGPWRDTHVALRGPAVLAVQMVFAEDYYWATGGRFPELRWEPPAGGGSPEASLAATYLGSGPADTADVAIMFYLQCIQAAQKRLWIASPYFVPDPSILDALKMADLRGVDVRILLPPGRFEPHMAMAALSYLPELENTGIKLFRYPGFNHSKVMLVDDWLSWVGSTNLDNRSLRLNFEGNLVVVGESFAQQVEAMLAQDFARSRQRGLKDLRRLGLVSVLASKIARLFAPIL